MAPLLDYLIGGVAWLLGAGAPSQGLIDTVGAFTPAVLGALIPLPVFFLGRWLFAGDAAFVGALIVATLPGKVLGHTMLGAADHHVLEVLLGALTLVALVAALRAARGTDTSLWGWPPWTAERRAFSHRALLAGVALSAYLMAWSGGLFLLLVLLVWSVVELWRAPVARDSAVGPLVLIICATAFAVVLLFGGTTGFWMRHIMGLLLWLAGVVGVLTVRTLIDRYARSPWVGRAVVVVGGVAALFVFTLPFNPFRGLMAAQLVRMVPGSASRTVSEVAPLLTFNGEFSLAPAFAELLAGAFLAPLGLVLLSYRWWRTRGSEYALLLTWTVAVLAAALLQNRFSYYLAVPTTLLSGLAAAHSDFASRTVRARSVAGFGCVCDHVSDSCRPGCDRGIHLELSTHDDRRGLARDPPLAARQHARAVRLDRRILRRPATRR